MSVNIKQQLEKALFYIEQHLDEKMSVIKIADYAGISHFHFNHVFSAFFDETLDNYILQQRLKLATKKLLHQKGMGISEIAMSSGFESHRAFSKAFKNRFNITPSVYRNNPNLAKLKLDRVRSYKHSWAQKSKSIEVSIKELPALWLNHKRTDDNTAGVISKDNFQHISHEFKTILNTEKSHFFCLASSNPSIYTKTSLKLEDYLTEQLYGGIYSEKNDNEWSEDWLEIDEGLWAVCTHKGDYRYSSQIWSKFLHTWLPDSGYELRDTIHFGRYLNSPEEVGKNDILLKHLYLPIKKVEIRE